MNYFSLDDRKKEDILKEIKELAGSYVPEWRLEEKDREDPGAALVEIFSEMYEGMIDRLNDVPERFYYEYLNLLGVENSRPEAAEGLVQFNISDSVDDTVRVPENSLLYIAPEDDDDESVVYETCQSIDASSNAVKAAYYVNSVEGLIEKLDFNSVENFFMSGNHENLQRHFFSISQNDIFNLSGKAEIALRIIAETDYLRNEVSSHLTDKEHVRWFYMTEDGEKNIDDISKRTENIILKKNTDDRIIADEDGNYKIFCELNGKWEDFFLDGIRVSGSAVGAIHADELFYGEFPITRKKGGYCFGHAPAPYEEFYIKSDTAFNKKGSEVLVEFDMDIISYIGYDDSVPQYVYGDMIIDKNSAVALEAEDVYVSELVWEYYNGSGWNYIETKGNQNPFSGKNDGALAIRFIIPEDIESTDVNSREGYYIRARVVSVENANSTRPRWLLPFVKDVNIKWSCIEERVPEKFEMQNNAEKKTVTGWDGKSAVRLDIFSDIELLHPAVYICFEKKLMGMPFSVMFDLENNAILQEQVRYEVWTGKRFETVHVIDDTDNLEHSGPVYFYFNAETAEGDFFGENGYWLRVSAGQKPIRSKKFCPRVRGISVNVSRVVQRQHAEEEIFSNDEYIKNKKLKLLNAPVLDLEVWVNETDGIKTEIIKKLEKEYPDRIREEDDEDGVTNYWIKWKRIRESDSASENDRVYTVDPYNAEIRFGDGKYGMIVPEGFENIRVNYTYGGGIRGNADVGRLESFLIPVARVESVRNISSLSGGMGQGSMERVLKYGKYRISHQNRAVSVEDFDNIIYENFGSIAHVKTFDGMNADGEPEKGHVTVVISGMSGGSERTDKELCSKVKRFLNEHADCTLISAGNLEVRTASNIEIYADITVTIINPDEAASTQEKIKGTIKKLIEEKWAQREIGNQIKLSEVYKALKEIRNIKTVKKIIFEGSWYENGKRMLSPIENDAEFPYSTVRSGEHKVNIEI